MKKIIYVFISLALAICIFPLSTYAEGNATMKFENSNLYCFPGYESSFTLNKGNLGSDHFEWNLQCEDETISKSYYSTNENVITFSGENNTDLVELMDLESGDYAIMTLTVKAYNGATLLDTLEQDIYLCTEYCFISEYDVPEEIVKGETVKLDNTVTVAYCDTSCPEGVEVEGKVIEVTSSNTKVISVGTSGGKYTLKAVGALESYTDIKVKYSFELGDDTFTKTETFGAVFITDDRYDIDLTADNDMLVFGGTCTLTATGKHIYIKSGSVVSSSLDGLNLSLEKSSIDNVTDIEEKTSDNTWTIRAQNKPSGWDGYLMIDDYFVQVIEDGDSVYDSVFSTLYITDEYYDIKAKKDTLDIATDSDIQASDLVNVYLYDKDHTRGIVCDGENGTANYNAAVKFYEYNSKVFTKSGELLNFADADTINKFIKNHTKTTLVFDIGNDNLINDELYFKLTCSHNIPDALSDLIPATLTTDGKCAIYKCEACGKTFEDKDANVETTTRKTIDRVSTISLSATSYVYTGKKKVPTVTVKDSKGTTLVKDTDYTISYTKSGEPCESPTEVGSYKVVITGIGNYDFTTTKSFSITKASKTVTPSAKSVITYIDKTAPTITADTIDNADISCKVTKGGTYASVKRVAGTENWEVIGKKAGTATVTITAADTENYKSATTTVKVTVKAPLNINSSKYTTVGKAVWNNGDELHPSVTVKNGKTTYATSNYDVRYSVVDSYQQPTSEWEPGNYVKVEVDASNPDLRTLRGVYTKYVPIEKATQKATASVGSTIYYGTGKQPVKINHSNVLENADQNATYSSSNKKYATVDAEGNITPKAAGKVTITVNYKATPHYATKIVKLTVNVKKAVNISDGKLVTASAKYKGGAAVEPSITVKGYKVGTDYTVSYDTSSVTQAGQTFDVVVTAVAESGGCIGTCTKTVTVAKADPSITVTGKPTSIKAKATKDITISTSNNESPAISVTSGNKTYLTAAKVDPEVDTIWTLKGVKVYSSSIKVTVKTAATTNYNAKTITFNVKVVK